MNFLVRNYSVVIWAFLVIAVGIFIFIYMYYQTSESRLDYVEVSGFTITCTGVEKAGARYLQISTEELGELNSLGRITNCGFYSGITIEKSKIGYHRVSNYIYFLSLGGKTIISPKEIRTSVLWTLLIYYFVFCAITFGIYKRIIKGKRN